MISSIFSSRNAVLGIVFSFFLASCGGGGGGGGAPANLPPSADPGADQSVFVGDLVQLDGSGSSDPENDPLTWAWSFDTLPSGSTATLGGATTVVASFTPDVAGTYTIVLVVNDGQADSDPATVTVVAQAVNHPPVANAGGNQQQTLGAGAVTLDGTASFDPDNDPITYLWSFVGIPAGSGATMQNATTDTASFTPDVVGTYNVRLTVTDQPGASDTDDIIVDISANVNPVANAGADQDVDRNTLVVLDGFGSFDPEGQPLTYTWTQVYGPDVTGGTGTLSGVDPSFTAPNKVTTLLFDLRVDDGYGQSPLDRVQINVMKDHTRAVFVSLTGSNGNPGTRTAPVQSLATAIGIATPTGADVYAYTGTFLQPTLNLSSGVDLYGGFITYQGGTWVRDEAANPTGINNIPGTQTAVFGLAVIDVRLDGVAIFAANATLPGDNSIGLLLRDSQQITFANGSVQAGDAGHGQPGASPGGTALAGGPGGLGGPGCENSGGFCTSCPRPAGGSGGISAYSGGTGGRPGLGGVPGDPGLFGAGAGGGPGGPGTPPTRGDWNTPSTYHGQTGAAGAVGTDGAAGHPAYGPGGFTPAPGSNGSAGQHGRGGGGGGGGGGGTWACDSYGGGGGGGGGGGIGGAPGGGGQSGGASLAVYLWATDLTVENATLTSGDGGHGGTGGAGQLGGPGGQGGVGSQSGTGNFYGGPNDQDDGSNGGRGGNGGPGGRGGHGGGGAGGDSIGVVIAGGSNLTESGNTFHIGLPGSGGPSPGNAGSPGIAEGVHIP